MKLPTILTPDGRRGYAFVAIVGGMMYMSALVTGGLYIVRDSPGLVFWLALSCQVIVGLGYTGLIALFVKRSFKVSREGLEITDQQEPPSQSVKVEVSQ